DSLPDFEITRCSNQDGAELAFRSINLQDSNVFIGITSDQLGLPAGVIGQSDFIGVGVLHDMIIGDNIAALVPDKTRAGSLGNVLRRNAENALPPCQGGDVHDRGRSLFEEFDCGLFVLGEVASWSDRAWCRARIEQVRMPGPVPPCQEGGEEDQPNYGTESAFGTSGWWWIRWQSIAECHSCDPRRSAEPLFLKSMPGVYEGQLG